VPRCLFSSCVGVCACDRVWVCLSTQLKSQANDLDRVVLLQIIAQGSGESTPVFSWYVCAVIYVCAFVCASIGM